MEGMQDIVRELVQQEVVKGINSFKQEIFGQMKEILEAAASITEIQQRFVFIYDRCLGLVSGRTDQQQQDQRDSLEAANQMSLRRPSSETTCLGSDDDENLNQSSLSALAEASSSASSTTQLRKGEVDEAQGEAISSGQDRVNGGGALNTDDEDKSSSHQRQEALQVDAADEKKEADTNGDERKASGVDEKQSDADEHDASSISSSSSSNRDNDIHEAQPQPTTAPTTAPDEEAAAASSSASLSPSRSHGTPPFASVPLSLAPPKKKLSYLYSQGRSEKSDVLSSFVDFIGDSKNLEKMRLMEKRFTEEDTGSVLQNLSESMNGKSDGTATGLQESDKGKNVTTTKSRDTADDMRTTKREEDYHNLMDIENELIDIENSDKQRKKKHKRKHAQKDQDTKKDKHVKEDSKRKQKKDGRSEEQENRKKKHEHKKEKNKHRHKDKEAKEKKKERKKRKIEEIETTETKARKEMGTEEEERRKRRKKERDESAKESVHGDPHSETEGDGKRKRRSANESGYTFLEGAYHLLKREKQYMSAKEIVTLGLKEAIFTTQGKTPHLTLAASLYLDMKKPDSLFISGTKVGKVGFGLKEWGDPPLSGSSTASAEKESTREQRDVDVEGDGDDEREEEEEEGDRSSFEDDDDEEENDHQHQHHHSGNNNNNRSATMTTTTTTSSSSGSCSGGGGGVGSNGLMLSFAAPVPFGAPLPF